MTPIKDYATSIEEQRDHDETLRNLYVAAAAWALMLGWLLWEALK